MADPNLSSFIGSVADLLRGDYKQSEYGKVILPFTVLRRLDCVLAPTKAAVLAELGTRTKAGLNPEPFLLKKSGQHFYNTSPLDLKTVVGDQDHIGENLRAYLQAFSPAVRDIFERFEFHTQIDRLAKANLLYLVTEKFAQHGHQHLLVFGLRAKLDALGYYDDFEVDRVVGVELNPKAKQGDLVAALEPVVDRLTRRSAAARDARRVAVEKADEAGVNIAQDELDALALFKSDMGAFVRLYTFLSQIFDYGTTAVEKRAIFFKRLLPLLEFDRERQTIDLSKVVLTHHTLKDRGRQPMPLGDGDPPLLPPIEEAGSGQVRERATAYMAEIIEKLNDLFQGELTDQDKLVYVNSVLKGKLLESATLQQQAAHNSKEQFASSPDLNTELLNAIMGALDAHTTMSTQALNSESVRRGLRDILLNHTDLYDRLRAHSQ